jgi:hypothetical protein
MVPHDVTIGISASYNIEKNPYKEAADKYMKDIKRGSSLQTIPLTRSQVLGVDNVKFLYTLSGVPIIGYTIINALNEKPSGKNAVVRVVGNAEVGRFVELINQELEEKVEFSHEGGELSLSNSLEKLFEGKTTGQNYFVTGDIPYARGYTNSGYNANLTFDLNSQRLFDNLKSIKRNFYSKGSLKKEEHLFKEPNIFHFTENGYRLLKEFSDVFYANRKNGGLPNALYEYLSEKIIKDREFRKDIMTHAPNLAPQIINVVMQKVSMTREMAYPINFNVINEVASTLYRMDVEFRFTHRDVFRMLDIDGLNNDWVMYEMISRKLDHDGRYDKRIKKLQKALKDKTTLKEFPLLENLEEIVREYVSQVNAFLPKDRKIAFSGIESFFQSHNERVVVDELSRLLTY